MDNRTYRRLFHETKRDAVRRHNRVYVPSVASYSTRRNRTGDGYEVVDDGGRVVAQGFDSQDEADGWRAENQPRPAG